MSTVRITLLLALPVCLAVCLPAQQVRTDSLDHVSGLHARLEIIRDGEGVPHIRAGDEADAIFGLGFVHGQDRLWQLEYLRRLGRGSLSELLGSASLPSDKLFRTLGIAQSARATWAGYGNRQRTLVSSYVAGLNAATEQQRHHLPLEFQLLNAAPEPWTPEDVLVIAKVLAWGVDFNFTQELLRAQLTQKVGAARAAQLMPAYTADGPVIVPEIPVIKAGRAVKPAPSTRIDEGELTKLIVWERKVQSISGIGGQGLGSNNQVLGPSRSSTGMPLLASDPHLPSQLPSLFYRVHLTGGGLDVIGATVVGLPGVIMGHNQQIAWGWTNADVDVQDLFVERIIGNEVEYAGGREPLQIRREEIKVRGESDVVLSVRTTRHGPLISDLVAPNGTPLALRWAALDYDDDGSISANLDANRAGDWSAFVNAFRRYKAHGQNMIFGDTSGNIGYFLTGSIPIRNAGDGTAPVPGWIPDYEWKGYVPPQQLPSLFNPAQGYIATSNNKIAPDDYPYRLGNSFAAPYRIQRVTEMLEGSGRRSMRDLQNLQRDVTAIHARELLPILKDAVAGDERDRQALELLRQWDYRATSDSAAAAIFEAWYIQFAESVFAPELGDALWRSYSDQLHMVTMALVTTVRAIPKATAQPLALRALHLGLDRMAAVQGTADVTKWRWGKAHHAVFFHLPFDSDPELSHVFNRSLENGGDKHTVNVASNARWSEYDQRHAAIYRQIIDLGDLPNSRWILPPGESGLLFDPHYSDALDDWQAGRYRPMLFMTKAVDEHATRRLILQP